jgi:hypothetical protein
MRRMFWTSLGIGLGAAAGVLVARRLRRTAEAFTPSSIAGGLAGTLRGFLDDVREGMHEREDELYSALGIEEPYPDEAG